MPKRAGALALTPPRILLALGTVSLALAASVGPSSAAAKPADAVFAISLVEQRVIEIPDSRLLSLSPDGGSIAVTRPVAGDAEYAEQLCIHDSETLAERACADVSELDSGLWVETVVWSPDSQWLAFAELWPLYFAGGDLWLMDASTGGLTNLLDDANTLPQHPTFTPDSAAVTFARTVVQGGEYQGSDIATVPVTGGDAVRVGDSMRGPTDYYGLRWTADGSRLYALIVHHQGQEYGPDSGIWLYEAEAEHARQLGSAAELDHGLESIVAATPRGKQLLVRWGMPLGREPIDRVALVDGDSGAVEPITSLRPKARRSKPIIGATLSPDGALVLTVSGRRGRQVAVRDVAGLHETILLNEERGDAPSGLSYVSTWAQNDTVLILGGGWGRGTLLVLDRGDRSGT